MAREFMDADVGKPVVTSEGEKVGTVARIEGETAYVNVSSGLAESTRQRLGWEDEDENVFEVDHSKIENINDLEITLTQRL